MNCNLNLLRRKIGVGILVMACVFSAGWARSLFAVDQIYFPWGTLRTATAFSFFGGFSWGVVDDVKAHPAVSFPRYETGANAQAFHKFVVESPQHNWDWQWGGFVIDRAIWVIPYWSVVTPLILISLWLLRSKLPVNSALANR